MIPQLLCTWHVHRNWHRNLNKIKGGNDIRNLVHKILKALLRLTNVDKFEISLNQVLYDLLADDDTKDFGEYFQNYYFYRPECLAYCYRLGYLENFHKVLKHVYLERRKVMRLDKTANALMKLLVIVYLSVGLH